MDPEAAFLAAYAVVLVCCAAGLRTLGRRSTTPWSSRMLAASRPPDATQAAAEGSWPHSELPSFHYVLSRVALTAALVLTMVSVVRHHRPAELMVQLTLGAFVVWQIARARPGVHGHQKT